MRAYHRHPTLRASALKEFDKSPFSKQKHKSSVSCFSAGADLHDTLLLAFQVKIGVFNSVFKADSLTSTRYSEGNFPNRFL